MPSCGCLLINSFRTYSLLEGKSTIKRQQYSWPFVYRCLSWGEGEEGEGGANIAFLRLHLHTAPLYADLPLALPYQEVKSKLM